MADPEIARLREMIAARPRAADIAQMRLDTDERGKAIPSAGRRDGEAVNANGVQAEWTVDAGRRSRQRHAVSAWRRLCDRLARQPPPSGGRGRPRLPARGPWRSTTAWRRNIRFPPPVRGRARRVSLPAGQRHQAGPHLHRRRQRRRRAGRRRHAGDPRGRPAAARLRLVHLALGRHGVRWAQSFVDRADARSDGAEGRACWMMAGNGISPAPIRVARSPRRSMATCAGCRRLLIQVGAVETLLDDSLALARMAGHGRRAGRSADLARNDPRLAPVPSRCSPPAVAPSRSGGSFVRNARKGNLI